MVVRRTFLKSGALSLLALPTVVQSAEPADAEGEQWYWYPGHLLTMKATGKETGNTCTWMLVENGPREGVPFHKHLYEDESFYVVEGTFEISVGDRTVTGGRGTYLYGPRQVPHRWTNIGMGRGRILNVFAPSGIEGYFLGTAIPIATRDEKPVADLAAFQAKTAAAREKYGIVRTGPLKFPGA